MAGRALGLPITIIRVGVGITAAASVVAFVGCPAASASTPGLPGTNGWVAYDPVGATASSTDTPKLVRAEQFPCPDGTTGHKGDADAYNCLAVFRDNGNKGHSVLLRRGRSGGFGYLHALLDHGVDQETIATVIANSSAGVVENKDKHKYLYGLVFRVKNREAIAVEVVEARTTSNDAPDGENLGVNTAYCVRKLGGPHEYCPEWVNASIP